VRRLGEVVAQMAREDKKDRQDRGSLESVFQRGETDFWSGGRRRGRTKNGTDACMQWSVEVCSVPLASHDNWPMVQIARWSRTIQQTDRPPICSNVAMFICRGTRESMSSI